MPAKGTFVQYAARIGKKPEAVVAEWLLAGNSLLSLAQELANKQGVNVTQNTLRHWAGRTNMVYDKDKGAWVVKDVA